MTARIVIPADSTASVTFTWDGGTANLTAGQILDVPPAAPWRPRSALPNLTPLTGRTLISEQQGGGGGVSN